MERDYTTIPVILACLALSADTQRSVLSKTIHAPTLLHLRHRFHLDATPLDSLPIHRFPTVCPRITIFDSHTGIVSMCARTLCAYFFASILFSCGLATRLPGEGNKRNKIQRTYRSTQKRWQTHPRERVSFRFRELLITRLTL